MGYTKQRGSYQALSGVVDVALAAKSVVEDPCLYDVTSLLLRLNQLEQAKPATTSTGTPAPPAPTVKGIGLCKAVKPLRAVVYIRENPMIGIAAAVGVVGGLVAIGYLVGSSKR